MLPLFAFKFARFSIFTLVFVFRGVAIEVSVNNFYMANCNIQLEFLPLTSVYNFGFVFLFIYLFVVIFIHLLIFPALLFLGIPRKPSKNNSLWLIATSDVLICFLVNGSFKRKEHHFSFNYFLFTCFEFIRILVELDFISFL